MFLLDYFVTNSCSLPGGLRVCQMMNLPPVMKSAAVLRRLIALSLMNLRPVEAQQKAFTHWVCWAADRPFNHFAIYSNWS